MPKQFVLALSQHNAYSHTAHAACVVSGSQDFFDRLVLLCRETAEIFLFGDVSGAVMRIVFHNAVVHWGGVRCRVLGTLLFTLV